MPDYLKTADIAERWSVRQDSIIYGIKRGYIPKPAQDRSGHFIFTTEQAEAAVAIVRAFKKGRKKGKVK